MAYDNGMCAHVWAQQNKASGRTSNGNMSFEGATLYSYSTPIGRFVETVDGRRAVLVTSHRYSTTTSGKHMPALRRAIDYGRGNFAPCFTVPELGYSRFSGVPFALSRDNHAANLAHLVAEYDEIVAKASRARTYYRAGLIDDLERKAATAQDYAAAFGLSLERQFCPLADFDAIEAKRAAREAKASTPAAIERRERERAKREGRDAFGGRWHADIDNPYCAEDHRHAAWQAGFDKAKRADELKRAEAAERIAAWRTGEIAYLRHDENRDGNGGALLRVRGDKLETSQGASVPLADAIKVFRFVKLCRERGEAWHRNGLTLPVGPFSVDNVQASGTFRAGCHLIHWPEIEQAARQAGVLDITPADTREGEAPQRP